MADACIGTAAGRSREVRPLRLAPCAKRSSGGPRLETIAMPRIAIVVRSIHRVAARSEKRSPRRHDCFRRVAATSIVLTMATAVLHLWRQSGHALIASMMWSRSMRGGRMMW
jgi:hypothetical protein